MAGPCPLTLELVVLGTGAGATMAYSRECSASFALRPAGGGRALLLADAGLGVVAECLARLGEVPQHVYVSHNHSDHAGELPILLAAEAARGRALHVYSEQGVMGTLLQHRLQELRSTGKALEEFASFHAMPEGEACALAQQGGGAAGHPVPGGQGHPPAPSGELGPSPEPLRELGPSPSPAREGHSPAPSGDVDPQAPVRATSCPQAGAAGTAEEVVLGSEVGAESSAKRRRLMADGQPAQQQLLQQQLRVLRQQQVSLQLIEQQQRSLQLLMQQQQQPAGFGAGLPEPAELPEQLACPTGLACPPPCLSIKAIRSRHSERCCGLVIYCDGAAVLGWTADSGFDLALYRALAAEAPVLLLDARAAASPEHAGFQELQALELLPEFQGKEIYVMGYGRQDEAPGPAGSRLRFARPGQVIQLGPLRL